MGFRIDKSWGRYVAATPATPAVRRKHDDHPGGGDGGQNSDHQQDKRKPSFEEVKKAVEQENAVLATHDQGLHVELVGTEAHPRIRLTDSSGHVIREMDGEEFLQLRASARADTQARGKVLDQKC